jgi:hypothetical protein
MIPEVRLVRGVLFVDYVRMLRAQKPPRLSHHLTEEDLGYLQIQIHPDSWYPMASFERLGNALLATVTNGELFPVRLWGRYSVTKLMRTYPTLLAPGEPVESLNRFRVLRETFFNFPALEVAMLHDDTAHIAIRYHMGMPAEEAAAFQTMGFFEGLLEHAGARDVRAEFAERSWADGHRTLMVLRWGCPTPQVSDH